MPGLRSYEPNKLSIDPTDLPVDVLVGSTREVAVPADRSGVVVKFDIQENTQAALVSLRTQSGEYVQAGATGQVEGSSEVFIVGYDGQGYITGLGPLNRVIIDQPSGHRCSAEFAYEPRPGEQVAIPDVICRGL